jgi:alpha-glucosidase (family GH31 glycosyl hydrolase)
VSGWCKVFISSLQVRPGPLACFRKQRFLKTLLPKERSAILPVILLALSSLFTVANCQANVYTLESSVLRLEVTTSPYSYRVIEKSSGDVLISQHNTAFTFGTEFYPVAEATSLTQKADSIRGNLTIETAGRDKLPGGAPDNGQIAFTFLKPEVLQVEVKYNNASPNEVSEEFNDQGEHYYGIWEYPFGGHIDNRGADADFLGLGNERYVHHASARAPFYLTSRKYGVYVESLAQGHFAIAQVGKTRFSFKDSQLKYDIIAGPSYADILKRYNAMAGPSFMPPTWAFGSIWWRDDEHEDLRDAANAQVKVIDDADRLRKLHIPAGAIWLDRPYGSGELGWGAMDFDSSFPDPPKMIRDLNDRGMTLLLWIANRCSGKMFDEGSAKGYLFPVKWPAADIRRPEVYDWWKEKLNAYVRMGIKGYKIDRGEEGEMPRSLENQFAVLYPKLAADGLSAAFGSDYFTFTRNANDTARKYTAIWNGDSWSNFDGLQTSIKNGLRAGAIDFPMWGSDTGGYFAPSHSDKDLLARWLEFSAFSPMMEVILGPRRTIWYDYDDELVRIAQQSAATHHDLIPYTRSYMYQATQTGMPIMRSLIFAFPDDERVADLWDEYLYGDAILVAPIITAQSSERRVYLPAGRWMNYADHHTIYTGKNTVSVRAPIETIPSFIREGAIVPRGDIAKLNNNWDKNWSPKLRIEIFPSSKTTSFDYFTGKGLEKISVTPSTEGINIQFADLGTNGALNVYCKRISGVQKDGRVLQEGSDYQYDSQAQKLTIPFVGSTNVTIKGALGLFD